MHVLELQRLTMQQGRAVRASILPGGDVGEVLIVAQRLARMLCEECKRRNYQTNKSKRNNPDRIALRKYCRWCRRHTSHRETR